MTERVAYNMAWRNNLRKHAIRRRLQVRIPQAEDIGGDAPGDGSGSESPESPDSDLESDDGEAGEESEDEDETDGGGAGDSPQAGQPGTAPTATGFITLVPAQPSDDPAPSTIQPPGNGETANNPAAPTAAPQESAVNSLSDPTTLISSTIVSEPLAESTVPVENGAQATFGTTAAGSSETAGSSSIPSGSAQEVEGNSSGGPELSRGEDVGIIFGTLAIASILIAAGIIFYRRRKKANSDHLDRLPYDKPLPTPPDDPASGSRNLKLNSWAVYVPRGESEPREQPNDYYVADEKMENIRPMNPGVPPQPPPVAYNAAGRQSSMETGGSRQMNSQYGGGQVPPPTHQPAPRVANNLDIYPPGQVPIDQFRVASMAQTQVSDTTEGTWRTWNVDQRQQPHPRRQW